MRAWTKAVVDGLGRGAERRHLRCRGRGPRDAGEREELLGATSGLVAGAPGRGVATS